MITIQNIVEALTQIIYNPVIDNLKMLTIEYLTN